MSASVFRIHRAISGAVHTQAGAAAPPGAGDAAGPSLTTTVPKEFVHRASVAEVLLTDWARVEESRFTVAAQWPRGHSFFAAVDGCHDPLIAAETIRQTGILLAHAEFGVPLGHHLLVEDLDVQVRPAHVQVGLAPASLDIDVRCSQIRRRRGGALNGCRIEVDIYREGRLAATGGGSFTCVAPAVYRRLRAGRTADGRHRTPALNAALPPHSVGRTSPADVVLSPSPAGPPGHWQLRADTRHPVLFDHPVDHVPGMVLLEAARQATAATLGRACLPLALTSEFLRYVELDTPCTIEAHRTAPPRPDREESVQVSAHQNGTTVFRSTVTMAPPTP